MEKSLTVSIYGITESRFLELWSSGFTPSIYDQETKIILTIPPEQESAVDELARFAEQHGLDYFIFFQAYDFTADDRKEAPLLAAAAGTLPGAIHIVEGDPTRRTHCPVCESINVHLDTSVNRIKCKAKRKPAGLITSDEDGLLLFHRELLNEIRNAGYAKGLEVMPCEITFGKEVDENYFWPYSHIAVGAPSGNIVYDHCSACATPIVKHRRDFVTHYSRSKWAENDFAVTDSPDSLLISQGVFKLLQEKVPSKAFSKLTFTPCMLD